MIVLWWTKNIKSPILIILFSISKETSTNPEIIK